MATSVEVTGVPVDLESQPADGPVLQATVLTRQEGAKKRMRAAVQSERRLPLPAHGGGEPC